MKKPVFDVYRIADVSTGHITREDGFRIGDKEAPGHLASIDPIFNDEQGIEYVRFDRDGGEVENLPKFEW